MASTALCVCFPRAPRVSREAPNKQVVFLNTSALSMGSSQAVSRTAMKMPNVKSSNRGKYIIGRRHHDHLMKPFRHICSQNKHRYVSSDINIVISGYWVGPETEDGCGYIEAVVVVFDY